MIEIKEILMAVDTLIESRSYKMAVGHVFNSRR